MTANGIAVEPTPEHLTLLFKYAKSTTVLSILPDQEWTQIKAHLLDVLASLGKTTFPDTTTPLPSSPDQLELGVLKDRKDHTKGWESIEAKQISISEVKAGKKKASNTPRDFAIRDGSYIAYRLREESTDENTRTDPGWEVMFPADEYDDEMEEEV